jgi:hypothetical protein
MRGGDGATIADRRRSKGGRHARKQRTADADVLIR